MFVFRIGIGRAILLPKLFACDGVEAQDPGGAGLAVAHVAVNELMVNATII
jgi:hypothetical protein